MPMHVRLANIATTASAVAAMSAPPGEPLLYSRAPPTACAPVQPFSCQQTLASSCCHALAHPLLRLPQTTKAHITVQGGTVEELVVAEGLAVTSAEPFKGNMDCERLADCIQRYTPGKIAFVRVEAGTNLIGGQPFSLQNLRDVREVNRRRLAGRQGGTAAAAAHIDRCTLALLLQPGYMWSCWWVLPCSIQCSSIHGSWIAPCTGCFTSNLTVTCWCCCCHCCGAHDSSVVVVAGV